MARVVAKPKVSFCNECCREYPLDRFYESTNRFHKNGVMLYCKDCCEEIVKYYLRQTGTLETAMWFSCAQIGIPFIKKVYEDFESRIDTFKSKSGKDTTEYNLFSNYIYCLKKNESKTDEWNDFSATDVALGDIQHLRKSEQAIQLEIEKYKLLWGDHDPEDYEFLEYQFDRYTKDKEFTNPQEEDLYRDLCLARLKQRKIEEGSIDTESSKQVQDRILQLMAKLKIDEFESNKAKTLSEQALFEKIRLCNENNVRDIYKEPKKFADHNKLLKYNKEMVLRPLGNMLVGNRDFNINIDDIEEYNID